jgi:hypothetical protein
MASLCVCAGLSLLHQLFFFLLVFFFGGPYFLCAAFSHVVRLALFLVSGPGRCSPRLSQNRT